MNLGDEKKRCLGLNPTRLLANNMDYEDPLKNGDDKERSRI